MLESIYDFIIELGKKIKNQHNTKYHSIVLGIMNLYQLIIANYQFTPGEPFSVSS